MENIAFSYVDGKTRIRGSRVSTRREVLDSRPTLRDNTNDADVREERALDVQGCCARHPKDSWGMKGQWSVVGEGQLQGRGLAQDVNVVDPSRLCPGQLRYSSRPERTQDEHNKGGFAGNQVNAQGDVNACGSRKRGIKGNWMGSRSWCPGNTRQSKPDLPLASFWERRVLQAVRRCGTTAEDFFFFLLKGSNFPLDTFPHGAWR